MTSTPLGRAARYVPAMSDTPKPALYVGLAGDAPRSPSARIGLVGADRVDIGRADRRRIERGGPNIALGLPDPRMSAQHVRLSRHGSTWLLEDVGSRNGTWLGSQRLTRRPLQDGDAIVVGHTALVFRGDGGDAGDADHPHAHAGGMMTMSPVLDARFAELAEAARSLRSIQLAGEVGSGKELAARAVHELSGRSGAFVPVSCGALPASEAEAMLLGAVQHAAGGTLFLAEVAELPPQAQAELARVLETAVVRLITATRRDLDVEVATERLHPALASRMAGLDVRLPPLRQRLEDLGLLIGGVIERSAGDRAIMFSFDAVAALYAHDWPLNLRELERSISAALGAARDRGSDRIEIDHLPAAVGDTESLDPYDPGDHVPVTPLAPEPPRLSEQDRALRATLAASIARHQGNLAGVAREMGKDRTQIRRWMKRLGLTRDNVTE
jgi:DNA-binding NtrC family response regulator